MAYMNAEPFLTFNPRPEATPIGHPSDTRQAYSKMSTAGKCSSTGCSGTPGPPVMTPPND